MTIEDLSDWNTILSQGAPWLGGDCGCCQMPGCPLPELECGSAQVEVAKELYLPFVEPAGDPETEIETLYASFSNSANTYYQGTAWVYTLNVLGGNPVTDHYEELSITTFEEDVTDFDGSKIEVVSAANLYTFSPESCGPTTPIINQEFNPQLWATFTEVSSGWQCTETRSKFEAVDEAIEGDALTLFGCPGPFTAGDESFVERTWDLRRYDYNLYDLETPTTKASMREEGMLSFVEGIYPGTDCEASLIYKHNLLQSSNGWPTKASVDDVQTWDVCDGVIDQIPVWCYVQRTRYRWVIPDTFEGSYFKVTWDILEEPDGWDATIPDPEDPEGPPIPDPDAPDRSFVSQDNTWEWAGPGDPEDPDSWKSGWYEIDPPTVAGVRRVVNIRYECYRSPYGNKPEITGEGVTLPDP